MYEGITQARLSMRLDTYLSDYQEKQRKNDHVDSKRWETVWEAAEVARAEHLLTPELVDDVRMVLHTL